jgi:peptide deformylase
VAVKEILLLGDPRLFERCHPVVRSERELVRSVVGDLHDTLMDFHERHGYGRAIAAPQIGVLRRIVYMHIDAPVAFVNPVIDRKSERLIELWDDCMSFPPLLVRVHRHHSCRITYRDEAWEEHEWRLTGDLSELLQHEVDHLDGILAVQRAIDGHSFALREQLTRSMPERS